ncbi:glycosyltransferase family 2 protein [Peloplasma aerotolerans]|uniref:Glycosyltransferase family 2 protein n=1 Tax=Peloplasma aerotolerans TaxID=3044389 RepID=A0AAW6UD29_9MOLU|nr:glycosyltransferase family 2 protein [Mariniplasma sp. M4Ah]MDI6453549.1 glycosyltransferase family 2 protein [Mariniplasma sp. M4Ah]
MSFIINIMENDTLKYWKRKLKRKWYKMPFLLSKNTEIEAFMSEYEKPEPYMYDGMTRFELSSKENTVSSISKIAIVVPVYVSTPTGKKQVERLIKSIQKQERLADNVFLIDDCSPFEYETFGYNVFRMNQNGGPAKARNYGIDLAKESGADIIAFTDSDVVLPSNWILSIVDTFIKNRFMQAISGRTISYGKTWYDWYHNVNGTLNGRRFKDSKQLLYGPTCNFAIETKALDNQYFSIDFPLAASEDIEFCYRFLERGNNIGHDSSVVVYHDFGYKPLTLQKNKGNFIKVFKKYAKGEKILLKKIPQYYYFLNQTIEISNCLK